MSQAMATTPAATMGAEGVFSSTRPLRVTMVQYALPRYRVPVFREIAGRPGIDFTLVYSEYPGLPNAPADGFKAIKHDSHMFNVFGQEFWWHHPQWSYATREKSDVLVLSWSTRYWSLIPALLRARWNGVAVVLWGHGSSKREARWRTSIRNSVTKLASSVLFYGRRAAKSLVEWGVAPERVFVAPNSLDQSAIRAAREQWVNEAGKVERFRAEKGWKDTPVIIFVSRLDVNNRASMLVEAAEKYVKDGIDVRVLIVGSGDEGPALEKMIKEKKLEKNVLMLGAIYNEVELAGYFLAADVFCYPRNIGLSILHAFGYGKPVVTGDHIPSHNPEIDSLREGYNGLMYKDGDAESLYRTLRKVTDDGELRDTLSRGALETATHAFTIEKMIDGMECAIRYAAMCAEKRG